MADRDNPYEAAFEEYLRARTIPYVAVDESRRSLMAERSLKSLDFIVSSRRGERLLVDVKGRRFPSGGRRQYWKNWSTQDDLRSLAEWERVFGNGFRGLFVFAYEVRGDRAPLPAEKLFEYKQQLYGFVGIPLSHYMAHARQISPRWETVAMPCEAFRSLAAPFDAYL
jgi:hypothetical protein